MNKYSYLYLATLLSTTNFCSAATTATAAPAKEPTPQYNKIATCAKQANDLKLTEDKSAERERFMRACLRGLPTQ